LTAIKTLCVGSNCQKSWRILRARTLSPPVTV
jgi:hypothetical protein